MSSKKKAPKTVQNTRTQEEETQQKIRCKSCSHFHNPPPRSVEPVECFAIVPPDNSIRPINCVWTYVKESRAKKLIAHECRLSSVIDEFIPDKLSPASKEFLKLVLGEVLKWLRMKNYSPMQASAAMGIFILTHEYFCSSGWRSQDDTYYFFKECTINHTVQDPPVCVKVFDIHQCQDILLLCCQVYLPILPLLRVCLLPLFRIELNWQTKPLKEPDLDSIHLSTQRKCFSA